MSRGYTCFYLKVGLDERAETEMLAALRSAIGPERKIRVDANHVVVNAGLKSESYILTEEFLSDRGEIEVQARRWLGLQEG